jgi:hypothetical protein
MSGVLPCRGNEALYDIVLFGEGTQAERRQAKHRAAALCASCPVQCDQIVTVDTAPRELVLLEPGWMPPEREGTPDPEPRMPVRGKRTQHPDIKVGADYVSPNRRVTVWAEAAAAKAAAGMPLAAIADDLCVTVETAQRLLEIGRAVTAA